MKPREGWGPWLGIIAMGIVVVVSGSRLIWSSPRSTASVVVDSVLILLALAVALAAYITLRRQRR